MTAPEDATRVVSSAERAEQWKVNVGGEDVVSMTTTEIFSALRAGRASAKTLVWRKGMSEWTELGQVPSLALLVPRPDESPSAPPPSAPPATAPSAPASSAKPAEPSASAPPRSSATNRIALPRERDPASKTNLAAVRTTAPPVPRAAGRASMASIHPGVAPPPSAPLAAKPPAKAPASAANLKDLDDDDEGVTQVHTTQHLLGMLSPGAQKPAAGAPADEGKALAVYERPVATLAFAEGVKEVAEAPAPAAPPPPPQRSVAPARIIAVEASAPAPAAAVAAPKAAPAPAAAPPPSAPVSAPAPPVSPSPPASLPSVMVADAHVPVPSAIPDSLEPVTKHDELTAPGGQTRAGRRRKVALNRTVLIASAASAVLASLFTALLVRRSEPAPLVIVPSVASPLATPAAPEPVAPAPVAPAREPAQNPEVPVMDLSALPEDVEAPKKTPRREMAPAVSPAAKLAELAPESKPKRPAAQANPFDIDLDEDESPAPAQPPSTSTSGSGDAPAPASTPRTKPRATTGETAPVAPPAQAPTSAPPSQSPGF